MEFEIEISVMVMKKGRKKNCNNGMNCSIRKASEHLEKKKTTNTVEFFGGRGLLPKTDFKTN